MSDIRKILEKMDSMSKAERKPTGPKFPGYWKGTDAASKAKDKMVGGCEESIIRDLSKTATEKTLEWRLQESLKKFKEDDSTLKVYNTKDGGATFTEPNKPVAPAVNPAAATAKPAAPAYTGIDPIVRQRMGMQPATQDEIRAYLDKNPPVVQTASGPLRTSTGQAVQSGGAVSVARAADAASPDRERAEAMPPGKEIKPTPAPAQPQQSAPAPAPQQQPAPQLTKREPIELPPSNSAQTSPQEPINPETGQRYTPISAMKPQQAKPAAAIPPMPKNPVAGSWQDVWKNNPNIKNPDLIRVGQMIKMPNGVEVRVNKGDTLSKLAKQYRMGDFDR